MNSLNDIKAILELARGELEHRMHAVVMHHWISEERPDLHGHVLQRYMRALTKPHLEDEHHEVLGEQLLTMEQQGILLDSLQGGEMPDPLMATLRFIGRSTRRLFGR